MPKSGKRKYSIFGKIYISKTLKIENNNQLRGTVEMRIMVLGCGAMGSGTVEQLIKYSDAEIIAVDIDIEKPRGLAARLGTDRVTVDSVDVNDYGTLVRKIKTANPDVVANSVGPFYLTAGKVYRACIDAGVDCVDICDDPPGTKEALALHEEAEKAGITIVSGAGDSPGLSNIVVSYCANRMDRINDVNIYWITPWAFAGLAQFYHGIHMYAHSHQFINGKLVEMKGKVTVEFPSPFGTVELAYCDHPEPYTIPIYVQGVKNVRNAGTIWPKPPLPLEDIANISTLITEPMDIKGTKIKATEFLVSLLECMKEKQKKFWEKEKVPYDLGATRVEIIGEKDETPREYVFSGIGQGLGGTSRTLATIAKMLAKKEVKVKGAYAPEGCIDPELFIREFSGGKLAWKEVPRTSYITLARIS
ncbi:MAG: saccharopine dehydrogenase family protein [Candidatus Freyrarchaeum guaymaensis]